MNNLFYTRLAIQNLKKNSAVTVPYLLTCIGSVMMYYIISSLTVNPGFARMRGGGSMAFILMLGCVVMAVFSVMFLIYTNSFLVKRRKQEFGLFQVLGMGKKHLARIMAIETLLTAAVSLVSGILLGFLLYRVFALLLYRLMKLDISWDFSFVPEAAFACVKLFGVIFLVILLYNIWQVAKARPVEMLAGKQAGEREPKAPWLLAVLGVISLAAGYWIAVSTERTAMIIFAFFIAVLFVIAGTGLLFTAGSVTLLKLLKKNKGYYYQTRHFISVSGMIYRMKQNAAGLSVICLLSTAVLVMLSSTVSLYVGLDDVMRNRFKRDYVVTVYDYSDDTAAKTDGIVESALKDAGETAKGLVSYRYVSFAAVDTGDGYEVREENLADYNSLDYLFFMTLEDYNRISGQNVSLRDDQVMVLADGMRYDRDTFSIFGRRYDVAGLKGQTVEDGMDAMGSVGSLHIVLPDFSQLEEMEKQQAEAYGEAKSRPVYYVAFDAGDGKEGSARLYKDLEERLNGLGLTCRLESAAMERGSFFSLYGGLFFVGLFLGTLFVMATVLIIYYKQISEGYEDKKRFEIMQNVGLSAREIKSAIRSQVLTMFFLPLVTAAVHICFAFPMIARLLALLNLRNVGLFAVSTAGAVLLFAVFYGVIYGVTSKKYYEIVKR